MTNNTLADGTTSLKEFNDDELNSVCIDELTRVAENGIDAVNKLIASKKIEFHVLPWDEQILILESKEQIKALVRSINDSDTKRFYRIVLQVAVSASKKGQSRYASDLTELAKRGSKVLMKGLIGHLKVAQTPFQD